MVQQLQMDRCRENGASQRWSRIAKRYECTPLSLRWRRWFRIFQPPLWWRNPWGCHNLPERCNGSAEFLRWNRTVDVCRTRREVDNDLGRHQTEIGVFYYFCRRASRSAPIFFHGYQPLAVSSQLRGRSDSSSLSLNWPLKGFSQKNRTDNWQL